MKLKIKTWEKLITSGFVVEARRYLPCIQTIIKITIKITIYKINLKIGVASLRHQEKGLFRNNNKKKGLN